MDFIIQNVWVLGKQKVELNEMKDLVYQMISGTGKYLSLFKLMSIYHFILYFDSIKFFNIDSCFLI